MPRRRTLRRPRADDRRSPLERLASLAAEPAGERARRMMERIYEELQTSLEVGPWVAAARTLAAQGRITENAALYLIEHFFECLTFDAIDNDPELVRIQDEIARVKREHGLEEDEDWYVHEGPAEWQELNAAWNRRDDAIRVATLRALGHDDVAALMECNKEDFDRRTSVGHSEFWGERMEGDRWQRQELN